jgi:hypothetical protein
VAVAVAVLVVQVSTAHLATAVTAVQEKILLVSLQVQRPLEQAVAAVAVQLVAVRPQVAAAQAALSTEQQEQQTLAAVAAVDNLEIVQQAAAELSM